MLLKNKTIAIIGAGPVGLTMAKLLQQKGIAVTVYERDENPNARIWGGTLDLHEGSGLDAIKKAGLLKIYYAKAIAMGRTIVDQQGKTLFYKEATPVEQGGIPEINRNDLRTLLLDSLTTDTVVWGSKFTGLQEHDGQWLLKFEHSADKTADLVIGANGGMSKVRKYLTDAVVEDTGTFIIQGEVSRPETDCPDFYQLCNHTILMTAFEGNLLVANPGNNGALTYGITFRKPEEWTQGNELDFKNRDAMIAFLANRFAHWDDRYLQLFEATDYFVGLPARKISLEMPWKDDRPLPITLIGDAAHLMPPFAGKGVNTGLMDALVLSDNLTGEKFETLAEAISDYERQMVVYATAAQIESGKNEIEMYDAEFSFKTRFNN